MALWLLVAKLCGPTIKVIKAHFNNLLLNVAMTRTKKRKKKKERKGGRMRIRFVGLCVIKTTVLDQLGV